MAEALRLVEAGAVMLQRERDDEVVFVLQISGSTFTPTAFIYPDDGEWTCDCGGSDPCAHVLAGAIALDRSYTNDRRLPTLSERQATLRYDLEVVREALWVTRSAVSADGAAVVLEGSLTDSAVALALGDGDRALDLLLVAPSGRERGAKRAVPERALTEVFRALSTVKEVRLDGEKIKVSPELLLPRGYVDAHAKGWVLGVEKSPSVKVLCEGVGLDSGVLRPLGETAFTGRLWQRLPINVFYTDATVTELLTHTLPDLEARISVERRSKKFPSLARSLTPRIDFDVTLLDRALSVLPTVVYGDPPVARITDGKLTPLGLVIPVRDTDAEVKVVHSLRDKLNLAPGVRSSFTGADVPKFIAKLRAWEPGHTDTSKSLFGDTPLSPRFTVRDDGFDLEFSVPPEGRAPARHANPEAVLRAFREGLEVVPLTDGGWAPVPIEWLREHGARVADLLAARRDDGTVARAALPSLAKLCHALEAPAPPALQGLATLLEDFDGIAVAPLPRDLTATLRPYQHRGVDWLTFLRDAKLGAILADDMGLGKTLQTLTVLTGRCLVVVPRSVLHNWADELQRFRPAVKVAIYHGGGRSLDLDAEVTLTTYAVLRIDVGVLSQQDFDVVVLDEAQAIKNPDSQAARAAYSLRAPVRFALSGTPVENRLEELWSLMHFANPGLLGGRSDFIERYVTPTNDGDPGPIAELRDRIKPFVLRRLKREVAPELPARTEVVLKCDLDAGEREIYDAVRAAAQSDIVSVLENGANPLVALEVLLRLRQAACHSGLVPGQRAERSSKVDALIEALESAAADGHRALVFSQWTSLLDKVEPHLRAAEIPFTRLDGSTRDRAEVVREFQSDKGPPVMLVSLKAGGTGLNLTAADHVFLLDPWWNPAVEDQAADRAHRIGQKRAVTIYRLVATDTVEERIVALQFRKRSLAEAALSGGDPTVSLTRDDLAALLS